MTDDPKFCKDCKHYRPMGFPFGRCKAVQMDLDMRTGKSKDWYADLQREYEHRECGPPGRLWERRAARWWEFWK